MSGAPLPKVASNGGVEIAFLDWPGGAGEHAPVLLVPGMIGAAEDWLAHPRLVEALRDIGETTVLGRLFGVLRPSDSRRVLAVSVRGRGRSGVPPSGWSIDDHVSDVLAVLEHERIPRAHVVGHSLGAFFALRLALAHPDRVASVTMGDYGLRAPDLSSAWATRLRGGLEERGGDPQVAALLLREWRALDLSSELAALQCPLLVVHSAYSGFVAPDAECAFGAVPRATVVTVAGDHETVFDQPDAVKACVAHLRQCEA